ncbi:MAG: hypothetical protein IPO30_11135 [Hyphomonadaceae bacterium]|nr:hypothetical protein [Hyphomonadaceae bacterium]
MRVILAALCALLLSLTPAASAEADPDPARAAADRLVAAMGGAEAWSRAHGLIIRARHWETSIDAPYENLIQMSFDEPRMRFDGDSATMIRRRAIANGAGWRVSELRELSPMTLEQVANDLKWWEAHAYRNIGRLARKDPTITPRLAADGRLELYRPDGVRLMWYRLNPAGEPVAFGAWDNEQGSVFGPLIERGGGIKLPAWATSADGAFRAILVEATALPAAPAADWSKP